MALPDPVACPLCGEPVPRDARHCANCGAEIAATEPENLRSFADSLGVDVDTARALRDSGFQKSEEATTEDPATAADESALFLCPSCGAFVSSAQARCPHCGADLTEESPARAPPPRVETEDELAGLCPNCGSIAPTGRQTCAVCGTSLRPTGATEHTLPPPPADFDKASRSTTRARPSAVPEPKRTPPKPPSMPSEPDDVDASIEPHAPAPAEIASAVPVPRPVPRTERLPAPRGIRVEGRVESRLDSMRDVAAVATVIASLAAAAAVSVSLPGREWGQLFAFGALFGIGLALLVPQLPALARSRILALLLVASLAILVAAPVLRYAGTTSATGDAALLGIGATGLAVVVARTRRTLGLLLAWTAGLLLLTVLSVSPFVFAPPAPPLLDDAMWSLGGGLALGAASILILRRWLRSATGGRLLRAEAAYSRRDYAKGVEEYEAAIALGRRGGLQVPEGWYGKGAALVAAGRLDEALAALDRALALDPENEVAWINKGTALSRLGRMSEALKCYNAAIKVNPSYEVAWNNKGNALARLGKPDLALACYERALEIDTGYRTAWVNKGFVLAKLGRFEEAAECADAALRLTTGATAGA